MIMPMMLQLEIIWGLIFNMRVSLNSMDKSTLLLMDELWQKKDIMPMQVSKTMQLKLDWNRIPSKNVAMSEEEFEEAIRGLALADAERRTKMGEEGLKMSNGKEILAGEMEKSMLLTKYISVVSPDRKGAYEKFNGKGDTIYGNFNQELMTRDRNGVWNSEYLTKEEMARMSKFWEIYINTMKEYEAEHGQIPYKNSLKSNQNPYSDWATYNPSAYPSLYNAFA